MKMALNAHWKSIILKTMLTLIFLNVLSILFKKIYLGIQFTTKTTGTSICFHNNFIQPTKVIDTVGHFSPLVTRAYKSQNHMNLN